MGPGEDSPSRRARRKGLRPEERRERSSRPVAEHDNPLPCTSVRGHRNSFTSQTAGLFLVHITSLLVLCLTDNENSRLRRASRLLQACLVTACAAAAQPSLEICAQLGFFLFSPEEKKAEKGKFADLETEGDVASCAVAEDVGRCHQTSPRSSGNAAQA